jgi:transposase InsO family protein
MLELGLKSLIRVKKYRSYKGDVGRIAPNILDRNFVSDVPNRKWATDVTEFSLLGKKLYLSPIIDLFNGEIISYNLSEHPSLQQTQDMLDKAFYKVSDTTNLILHSEQGWQYTHKQYCHRLEQKGIIQSMSRKGNCLDNAVIENFFGIIKSELFYLQKFESIEHFRKELDEYIDYYNNKRIKLKLNGLSPVQFRTQENNKK